MWSRNIFLFIAIFVALINSGLSVMTMEQITKAGESMRSVCQPKNKVSDELVNGIPKGNFPDDKSLKCYTNCILEMMQILKKGKLNEDSAIKQINTVLPEELRQNASKGLADCKDAGKGIKDNCEVAYAIVRCFYKSNPQFMFP